ncbi:extracellular small neutral protease [Streptomyces sulfonofaciens]|uniref:Extracellular small neutral protease n=1 Tax=Streptomyces sulfonofaciens TaxID=68272 RepID=A0A919KSR1_9ACTN|nr:snapalysin [Streptomyces sulfonofaciens]GHH70616.1 extracellular small neutral protease [Streptomyces sulfonofaciens]
MTSMTRKPAKRLVALALGLGLATAALGTAVPAAAQTATPGAASAASYARYAGSAEDNANTKAFFEAVLKAAAEKQAAHPDLAAVTVTYDPSDAPSYRSQISSAAQIWNSSVSNVRLAASSGGSDFYYTEGDDPRGSYASTDGHGRGYIFIDHAQSQQYDQIRIVAHETGHVLGLPDHYTGPCSELMSGGGPGPSCTNRYPDSNERSRVNQLWANGFAKALDKLNKVG